MKILNDLVVPILILTVTLSVVPLPVEASSCTYSEKYHQLPQIFTISSYVLEGTVMTIKNDTNNLWDVSFSVEKIWKGNSVQNLTVITNSLDGCGYTITTGNKYLVYAIDSPPFLQISWTKDYPDAQSDISLLNDSNFLVNIQAKDDLNAKLEAAKEIIGNMMYNNTSGIPFDKVAVDVVNSTLDIGIDNTNSTMSMEEYENKIKNIVGDVPIKIEFGQNVLESTNVVNSNSSKTSSVPYVMAPLQQFKSGVEAKNVICEAGFQLIIKNLDDEPACVMPNTVNILIERGWGNLP